MQLPIHKEFWPFHSTKEMLTTCRPMGMSARCKEVSCNSLYEVCPTCLPWLQQIALRSFSSLAMIKPVGLGIGCLNQLLSRLWVMLQSSAMMSKRLAFGACQVSFPYIMSLSTLSFSVRIWDIRSLASFVVMPTRRSVPFGFWPPVAELRNSRGGHTGTDNSTTHTARAPKSSF